jgi:RND family efflux transporter MFP subunit
MATNVREPADLRLLSRTSAAPSSDSLRAIPPPRFNWRTRLALPIGLLAALAVLLSYTARDALMPATAVEVVPVVVKSTTASSSASVVQAPGWVEADPFPIGVAALTDGIVKEVFVLEGHPVKAGQVVVKLVDDDARLELARAEAELADKQASLEAALRQWDNPVERTRAVASAEGMVAEVQAELLKNDAEIEAESARADELAAKVKRARQAFENNAATELEFIEADLQHKAQLATLQAARARKPVLEAQLKQRQADLDAAGKNLELRIEETQALASAKAALALATARRDEAKLKLDRTEVRSPADGVVMNRFAEPGAKLVMSMDDQHSSHAVRLYDPKRLQVRVDVPLADAAKVGVGQRAKVVVGVLPDKQFDGAVTRVVNEADVQKNTLQVKVAITNPTSELKPEMLARVKFLAPAEPGDGGTQTAQVVFAPENVVHRTEGGAKVWVVDTKRNVAVHRDIKLGEARQDGWIAVASGLYPGDLIIADPTRVRDGMKVKVRGDARPTTSASGPKGGGHESH